MSTQYFLGGGTLSRVREPYQRHVYQLLTLYNRLRILLYNQLTCYILEDIDRFNNHVHLDLLHSFLVL